MSRKIVPPLPRASAPRALASASGSSGHALRAVLLAALAAGAAGCDPTTPSGWPDDVSRSARRAGEWLGVLEPARMAGEMPAVHPLPPPVGAPSGSVSPAAATSGS